VNLGANKLFVWINDKVRQLRSIAGNNDLLKALVADDKAPAEGTRFPIGQHLNLHHPNGTITRLKICGVRSGGFSNVYTVVDLDEMRPYCLKENRATPGDEASKNENLAKEAEISLLLGTSPHLVATVGVCKINGRLCILTEHHPFPSLDIRLKQSALALDSAITYAIHLCRGLVHAQRKLEGFVHGDIKPGNCLISACGLLKLGDFGLASATGIGRNATWINWKNQGTETSNRSGRHRGGTAAYMAPELFGDKNMDRRASDVYAFGVTLFEMLCGMRPFAHSTTMGLVQMHRSVKPPLDKLVERDVPRDLIELTDRCLSKSPADRPAAFDLIEGELCAAYNRMHVEEFPLEQGAAEQGVEIVRRAFAFSLLGRLDESIALIDKSIVASDNPAELLAAKAIVFAESGYIERAYEASTTALMKNAEAFSVLVAHARVLIDRGKLETAAEYLQRAVNKQPDNCVVLNLLGRVYFETCEIEQARACLKLSLRIDGSQPGPHELMARIELTGKNYDAAAAFAQRSISIDPLSGDLHEILASAHLGRGRWVEALKSYKSALRFTARRKDARHRYVRLCLAMHDPSRSDLDGKLLRSLIQGGLILQRRDIDIGHAEKFVETVISLLQEGGLYPNLLFFHDIALARIAEHLSPSTTERLYQALCNFTSWSDCEDFPLHCRYSLGRVLYHLDKLEDCTTVFAEMLTQFGPNESSYYYLGACAEIQGDLGTALKFYKKANRLLECEDSRAGIRRVISKMRGSPVARSRTT
jgi:tetratricopeptide (TPR) repeat protein